MNETENQEKTAGMSEQHLPGGPLLPGELDNRATFLVEGPRPVHSANYTPSLADWSKGAAASTLHRAAALAADDFATTACAKAIAQLQRLISDEVKVIKLLRPDSLSAVLQPDSDTEILLQVHVRDGQIEADARCERGNFNALNGRWGQLQQSLAAQGVRLTPLSE